jgi:hypothetical protein
MLFILEKKVAFLAGALLVAFFFEADFVDFFFDFFAILPSWIQPRGWTQERSGIRFLPGVRPYLR